MPNNSGNGEVQRMMRDAADAVDMDFGCDGSGADGDKTDDAFEDDFDFDSADRDGYSSQAVINDINANRPVLLDGCSKRKRVWGFLWYKYSDCHMWVCDGYERHQNSCYSSLKLHMNWGWGGSYNGWFFANQWNPSSYNFQYAQDITHNIHP
jgi:Peptidase C10 family